MTIRNLFQGNHLDLVGSISDPWILEANLVVNGSSEASLLTVAEAPMNQGWANFTDIAVTHAGRYALNFSIAYPEEARGRFFIQSAEFELVHRDLEVEMVHKPDTVIMDEQFDLEAQLYDKNTQELIRNLGWKVIVP